MIALLTLRIRVANVLEETPLYTWLAKLDEPMRRFPFEHDVRELSGISSLCVIDVPIRENETARRADTLIAGTLDRLPKRGRILAYFGAGAPRSDMSLIHPLILYQRPPRTSLRVVYPDDPGEKEHVLEALFVATDGFGVERRRLRKERSTLLSRHQELVGPVRLNESLAHLVHMTLARCPETHIILAR